MEIAMTPVARIVTDFPTKFGVPRQSGLAQTEARIVLEPAYRNPDVFRGLEDFSHLWLLWYFSETDRQTWSPTVRPPRLGGNKRVGVFATRSPFRPNPMGLSCVKLLRVEGAELVVSGADLVNGTPIFDIKPYIPFADCHPDATGGYTEESSRHRLQVVCDEALLSRLPEAKRASLLEVLASDPRPGYQHDPQRVYGFPFADFEVRFTVDGDILTVKEITP